MRLEPIIAIILGSLIGMGVAFGIWQANKTTSPPDQKPQTETSSDASTVTALQTASDGGITITSPLQHQVLTEDHVLVTGTAAAQTTIAIVSEESSNIIMTKSDGAFESDIAVSGGNNKILVKQFGDSSSEIVLDVVYSSQVEGESLTFISGTITDISQESIQTRTDDGNIVQLSTDENTSTINILDDPKEIEREELAIGDYIIAIGTIEEDESLNTARILVSAPAEKTTAVAVQGTVTKLNSLEFSLIEEDGTPHALDAHGNIVVTTSAESELKQAKFSDIDVDDVILVVGQIVDDELSTNRIHIVRDAQ